MTELRCERRGGQAWLVMAGADPLHLYDDELASQLRQTLFGLRRDPEVDVIVLTADGECFSAGADLRREGSAAPGDGAGQLGQAYDALTQTHTLFRLLETMPQTCVAGVNGDAFGAGLILALLCDLIVVADEARVGFTMARFGLADGITTRRLASRVGRTVANELLLTGRVVRGPETVTLGLANRNAPRASFAASVEELAQEVQRCGPAARRRIKQALLDQLPPFDFEVHLESYLDPEVGEGASAFLERRPPRWPGRG